MGIDRRIENARLRIESLEKRGIHNARLVNKWKRILNKLLETKAAIED